MSISRTNPLHPRFWGGHLLLILALVGAVLLGMWQFSAWDAGRAAAARDLSNAPARQLQSVMGPDDTFPGRDLGRRVTFTGTWLPESTLFVSDRRHGDRIGYWVLTPVQIGESAMPVVRGWSAEPHAPAVSGEARITGWLQASEADKPDDAAGHDDVISAVRIASMTQHVDMDLYSAYVVSAAADHGLAQVSPDAVPPINSNTALRNLLYGVQWLAFGGFAGFIWWRWTQDHRTAAGGPTADRIDSTT